MPTIESCAFEGDHRSASTQVPPAPTRSLTVCTRVPAPVCTGSAPCRPALPSFLRTQLVPAFPGVSDHAHGTVTMSKAAGRGQCLANRSRRVPARRRLCGSGTVAGLPIWPRAPRMCSEEVGDSSFVTSVPAHAEASRAVPGLGLYRVSGTDHRGWPTTGDQDRRTNHTASE